MPELVAKLIELIGRSSNSWQEAAENALREASKTIRGITGIEVLKLTCRVESVKIIEYRTKREDLLRRRTRLVSSLCFWNGTNDRAGV